MIKRTIQIKFEELSMEELPLDQQELINRAVDATKNSYAKYSHFKVGAAIRLNDGSIVIGANQENAAFPLCLCAERTAIFAAQANYPDQSITQIAVCASNETGIIDEPVTPCGSCRQVMIEMEDRYKNTITVLLYGKKKIYRLKTIKDLLPFSFVDSQMR